MRSMTVFIAVRATVVERLLRQSGHGNVRMRCFVIMKRQIRRLNQDGMAYDADSGDGTVYEYNYSRQNEGGCVMFCMQEAIHNTFRNNVSYDDLGGTISPSENPDALLTDNIFYVRKGVPFVRKNMDGGNFTEENNQIIQL